MGDLTELIDARLEKILSVLIYGPDTCRRQFEDYEKELNKKYHDTFRVIEDMYHGSADQNDQMRTAVYELTDFRDDVYFEAGVIFGFQLFREIEEGYRRHKKDILGWAEELKKKNERQEKEHLDPELSELIRDLEKVMEHLKKVCREE